MFEAAELGQTVSKREYERELPRLRSALLAAHFALKDTGIPVCVIISGVDGAGKGEAAQRLSEWLDPRGVDTHAFWGTTDEEREHPRWWRFWRAIPSRGRVAIFFGSWYTKPVIDRARGRIKTTELDAELDRIAFVEKMLADDGALILKFWFHLPKKEQRRRLASVRADPRGHWRLLPSEWGSLKKLDKFAKVSERAIRRTDTGAAPWHLVEATDRRFRELATGGIILRALQERIASERASNRARTDAAARIRRDRSAMILDRVDLSKKLSAAKYHRALEECQSKLAAHIWKARDKGVSTVVVFEGWDAAGKGSAIRRVTAAMDPRLYRTVPIAAPSDEERARHYLWRFWRRLPRAGICAVFDRSWYGRVLVERVEGFARDDEWKRAYAEINDFEQQLTEHGIVLVKFWIHIDKREQLRRFRERERVAFKNYKITAEDWRNRRKWKAYEQAVNDMVAHCSTGGAPWTLVAGNDKKFARIQILETICERLERAL